MSQQPKQELARALGELVDSITTLRSLGRRMSVQRERLVELARAVPKPRLEESRVSADDARPQGDWTIDAPDSLAAVEKELGDCKRCKLAQGRNHIVFGEGGERAELFFIGEAPGADEDRQGRPFVGRAGQLLTKMIVAMGKSRDDVYIGNIIKCRPPGNRDPEPDEVGACEPFLQKQIQVIRPKVIVTLGRVAVQTLLRTKTPISRLRGQWQLYHDIKVMPTFHPAYLLRSPAAKKPAWDDLQEVMKELGWPIPKRKG